MLKKVLKELRVERNLKQEDIARIIGISASAYGYYEQGKTTPDPDTIIKLSEFYGVSTDYLLGRSNSKKYSTVKDSEDLPEEALQELENFKEYLKIKYSKKGQD
ncbi:helix-turn-helix transcriptional regulator [Peptostreptococcus russellii]|uniref:helix-turn-helix domain-containing protein n=1 Tax=Peptostreptococcus russellii TaxID=215200 RepID=UPI0016280BD9|nr:helix-turn-helix transcriptional regulator [Peptostreptococcus russellii]MBC2578341.1 helix-turn-helix transcriptional regulator [Peptostreptococcus russellii]